MKSRLFPVAVLLLFGALAGWFIVGLDRATAPAVQDGDLRLASATGTPSLAGRGPGIELDGASPVDAACADGQDVDCDDASKYPAYDITGTVLVAGTRASIEGAVVYCLPRDVRSILGKAEIIPGSSDAQGRFTVRSVPSGTWLLLPLHPEFVNPILREHLDNRSSSASVEVTSAHLVTVPGADDGDAARELYMAEGPVLAGTVIDPDGRAVAGAEIRARNLTYVNLAYSLDVMSLGRLRDLPLVSSDEAGHFRLACLPAALETAVLGAGHPRYAGTWSKPLLIAGGRGHSDLVLRVEPTARVEGRVRFDDGEIVPGARIVVDTHERVWNAPDPLETDAEGIFRLPAVPPGPVRLRAQVNEPVTMLGWGERLLLAPGEIRRGVEIVIVRRHPTMGRLCDTQGRPLAGECVQAQVPVPDDPDDFEVLARVKTDEDGRFALDLDPGLTVDLHQMSPRQVRRLATAVGTPATGLDLVSSATPIHRVEVRVLDADGSPVPLFFVHTWHMWWPGRPPFREYRNTAQGRNGCAVVEVLDGPPFFLDVSGPQNAAGRALPLESAGLELHEMPSGVLEVRLRALGEVHGIVVDVENRPVTGVRIRVDGERSAIAVKADGRFCVTGISPDHDSVYIRVEVPRGYCAAPGFRAWVGSAPVRIVLLRGGTVGGRLVSPVPVDMEGWTVRALWDDLSPREAVSASTEVAADGTFTIVGIPLERSVSIQLAAFAPWHDLGLYAESVEQVRAGVTDVQILLREGRSIHGRVLGLEGRVGDILLLRVAAVDERGSSIRSVWAQVEDEGAAFEIPALPPGRYAVRVDLDEHLLVQVEGVSPGARELEIHLPPLTRITGRVLGLPHGEQARVLGWLSDANDAVDHDWAVVTDEDGGFAIERVPAGRSWIVSAAARDLALVGVTAPVPAGRTDAVVRLEKGLSIAGRLRRRGGGAPTWKFVTAVGNGQFAWDASTSDGSFRLGPLLPGEYRILVAGRSVRRETVAVNVPAGTQDLEIELP